MSRRRSIIYKYFTDKPKEDKIAVCKLCKREINFKSTSNNLRKHLRNKHPHVMDLLASEIVKTDDVEDHVDPDPKLVEADLDLPVPVSVEGVENDHDIIFCISEQDNEPEETQKIQNGNKTMKESEKGGFVLPFGTNKITKQKDEFDKKVIAKKLTILNLEEAIKQKQLEKSKIEVQHSIAKNYLEIQILETEMKIKEAQLKKLL